MLRKTQNWGHRNSTLDHFGDVDVVNKYFTSVVCDKSYSKYTLLSELHSQPKADDANPPVKSYSDLYFMVILSKVTKTSPGSNGIPYWAYSECATELSPVLSCLINYSINECVWYQSHRSIKCLNYWRLTCMIETTYNRWAETFRRARKTDFCFVCWLCTMPCYITNSPIK